MAKKLFITLAILVLSFTIIGCSAQSSEVAMQIGPAELTEQESRIANLIQGNTRISSLLEFTLHYDIM